jgi:glycosyltransferase involved in cell wall biosynthesis
MQKLLCIAPHLSTGGLPQYFCKKIELLKDNFEIYLVEWVDCTGGVLVVTRNKITRLVDPKRLYTLDDNKQQLINIINDIQPDIIHLEEIPEFFMDDEITKQIYTQDRKYKIVETSHDSSYDTTQKKFFPDKFMFVSQWQINQYKDIDIPKVLVEYPIEYIERPDRTEALQALGLDPNKKHILHIGLFTPRKNQAEFFEYAKALPQYEFHCVGNQADNFRHYWEPLMKNKPNNLTWWNERTDVDAFYQAMDLFLFTSRGTNNDKETMPLVIREAVSYQIPILIHNLPVYLNYWDKYNVNYLDTIDFSYNLSLIESALVYDEYINIEEEAFVLSTYPLLNSVTKTTIECIEALKQTGRKIILTSHLPIPKELQELVDYCVYDKNNLLTKHTFYNYTWFDYGTWKVDLWLTGENNNVYHGPAVYTNYYNGAALAEKLGIKKVYFLNYDYVLKDKTFIDNISLILNQKKAYVGIKEEQEGNTVITYFLATEPKFYLNHFPQIQNSQEYDLLMEEWGSESNGLENLTYCTFQKSKNQIYWEKQEDFLKLIEDNFEHKNYSRVEYFSIIAVKDHPEQFAIFLNVANSTDNRDIDIDVYEDDERLFTETVKVTHKLSWFRQVTFNSLKTYKIYYTAYDRYNQALVEQKKIIIDKEYFENQLSKNGYLTLL